jgi:hypothetical protein
MLGITEKKEKKELRELSPGVGRMWNYFERIGFTSHMGLLSRMKHIACVDNKISPIRIETYSRIDYRIYSME